jgi:hypothetical protein
MRTTWLYCAWFIAFQNLPYFCHAKLFKLASRFIRSIHVKNSQVLRSGERAGQIPVYVFVSCLLKSPVVLSLFIKLWIVCLLGTFSSWNSRQHFLPEKYFTQASMLLLMLFLKYTQTTSMIYCSLREQIAREPITDANCRQTINKVPRMNRPVGRELQGVTNRAVQLWNLI